ncbi:MAG: DUF3352 domain-containing protein [Bacteroidetes bacterium]|nr:DUF3352 domain-containing protein [Bacteroidota bacterium]
MKKILLWVLLVLVVAIGSFVAYLYISPDKNINGLYLVPSDAFYILESDEPIDDWNTMSSSPVWQFLKQHPYFADITSDANYLDDLIKNNDLLFRMLGSRKFIMSAHQTRPKDYDFLFAIDLKRTAKAGILNNTLEKTLKSSGMTVTFRDYNGYELIESMDDAKDVLTMCKVKNFLVCSYSSSLVEKAIDEVEKPVIARDLHFQDVYKRVDTKGIGRLYIQYSKIDEMMACYMSQPDDMINTLSEALRFSALDLVVNENDWQVNGFTNLNETNDSYLLALLHAGKSKNQVADVLSNRSAFYLSFNFTSMNLFYSELDVVLQKDEKAYSEFQKNQKKIENLLGISVQEDLLSWISDEVTVAQMRSNEYTSRADNLVVCIRTDDLKGAQEHLDKIARQVKKRTPAKFKQILYRNYTIQYLDIKGFFRTFFGKAFQKLEKPFYTIIGDYVVFSNNPFTLIGVIEDFENDRTLSNDAAYKRYKETTNKESSLTLYISPVNTYPLMNKYADAETVKDLTKSKKYFDGFESFGFQFSSKGDFLNTQAYLALKKNETGEEVISEKQLQDKFNKYAEAATDTQFVVQMIEDGIYKKFFADGEHVQIEAEMKDGQLHGKYEEYYLSGAIKVRGKYKKGKKQGGWKYYDEEGNVSDKERF